MFNNHCHIEIDAARRDELGYNGMLGLSFGSEMVDKSYLGFAHWILIASRIV